MRVVRGRQVVEVSGEELTALSAPYEGDTADVGTGDGRVAYAYARRHPERFVVGLDPSRERLRETSSRSLRKPSRGGLPNVMFVCASVERPPPELQGRAGEVHVVLPWGALLRGIVLAGPEVLAGLRSLVAPDGRIHVVLGADVWTDPVPAEVRDLPELTVEGVERTLAPAYAAQGLRVEKARLLSRDEVGALSSSWARRLAHGRESPRFLALTVALDPGPAPPPTGGPATPSTRSLRPTDGPPRESPG